MILIKGAGDLATGVAHRLKQCGFNVVMTEISEPTMVRRTVAFSQAVYDKEVEVEGIKAVLASEKQDIYNIIEDGNIAILVDEKANIIDEIKPDIIIDAIIAKKNLGTNITDAKIVIALGPGFSAGFDCHCVVETKRGHYLGKTIYSGSAIPNTGVPGDIGGYTKERIIRAMRRSYPDADELIALLDFTYERTLVPEPQSDMISQESDMMNLAESAMMNSGESEGTEESEANVER